MTTPDTEAQPKHAAPRRTVPLWLRILIPGLLIAAWLVGGALGGQSFSKISEVSQNDQSSFLPASAESSVVQERLGDFTEEGVIPAVLVIAGEGELDAAQQQEIDALLETIRAHEAFDQDGVSPAIMSEDGEAAEIVVLMNSDDVRGGVTTLREVIDEAQLDGLTVHITGPAGFTSDLLRAFGGIDGILLLVAIAAVLLILLIVYRSPLLPIIVLLASTFALCVAVVVVVALARLGVVVLTGQTQGILFILVIGAATDYSLLYVARFREALTTRASKWDASWAALRGTWEPVLASGGTVIAGLLCLLLSDLNSNKSLGPVAAIGIAVAMVSAMTFLPAMMYVAGRAAFWPRKARFEASAAEAATTERPRTGIWARLGDALAAHPRRAWVITALVLAVACLGVTQLKADGVPQSDYVLGQSDARDGQQLLGEHFAAGSGTPTYVLTDEVNLDTVAERLLADDAVDAVAIYATDAPSGTAQVTEGGIQAAGPPGTPAPEPTVADGQVLFSVTLSDPADSDEAKADIAQLRTELAGLAQIGGTTATSLDTDAASIHDRNLIIPIVLLVIFVMLMLLLRSILAPLLLIATTVLSFGAALGVSALVFNGIFNFPGADPVVPLFGFVFLVALGIDYNIFLMTRVREESLRHGTREGMLRGLAVTGGVITSAGVVLAATFAALGVIPLLFLVQLAFIVAFGVLLDTLVVRSILVPALVLDIGRTVWWPAKMPDDGGRVRL